MSPTGDYATFAAHVGEDFALEASDGRVVPARLTGCTLTDAASGSFTLDFLAGPDAPGQDTYRVRGPEPVDSPVFLVPARRDATGTAYHAVFNHRLPSPTKDGDRQ